MTNPGIINYKAFKLLDILAAARKETRRIAGEGNRYQIPDPDQLKALGVPSIDAPEWTNLVELFRRPYFRMWIQQEVAMSADATVFCGKFRRPWKRFGDAATFL